MVAEAAHSWSDTGNEIFLLIAERSGKRPRDEAHPRGYGRATYIWSLVAAFGLFSAGAVVSIWHGITELLDPPSEEASFTVNYVVLAVAFVLEGTSFLQAARQVRGDATKFGPAPAALRVDDLQPHPARGLLRGLLGPGRPADRRRPRSACTSSPATRPGTPSARSASACCWPWWRCS